MVARVKGTGGRRALTRSNARLAPAPEWRLITSGCTGLSTQFDVSHLSAGTYFARLRLNDEMLITPFTISDH